MANRVSYLIQLKDKFSAAARNISAANEKIQTSAMRVNTALKKENSELQKLKKTASNVGFVMTAAVTLPLALMTRSMIKAGSDSQETANKFGAVFDDVKDKANSVAADFSKSFGVASSTSKKLLSDTGDLLVGFGFTGDAALDVSRRVNELASDLASFQNFEGGTERASQALTKALLGETEMAKGLGIVIRQNTKEFKDLVSNTAAARNISLQQAKALVILDEAAKQSKKAIGDTARTWDDYANVARRAKEANKGLLESFGKILIPVATKASKLLQSVAEALTELSPATKKVILTIGGILAVVGPVLLIFGAMAASISAIIAIAPVLATVAVAAFTLMTSPALLLAASIALITSPFLLIPLAIAGAVFAFLWLRDNWIAVSDAIGGTIEQIGINFSLMWQGVKDSFMSAFNFISSKAALIMAPIAAVKDFLGLSGSKSAPNSVPVNGGGIIDGTIKVVAEPGTAVTSIKSQATGKSLNLGMRSVGTAASGSP